MINFNGELIADNHHALADNRAFLFGDGVFETVKVINGKVLFLEDHYFRLMATMRIVRMEIPMDFTMQYFEDQIVKLIESKNLQHSARARITVFRNPGGLYLPTTKTISYIVHADGLPSTKYINQNIPYEVELYKDFTISKQLLSTIKTTNKMIHITASIFADENGYQNCLLMNDAKNIIETINGNIFLVKGNTIVAPPISDGCLNGILRKKLLDIVKKNEKYELLEQSISPFELQQADELFTTNIISGIQSISQYRKKQYSRTIANDLTEQLNQLI